MKLTQSQIDKFHEEGYLQLDNVLAPEDLNPVIWEFEGIIDRRARKLYAEGKITSLHERELFDRRIALLAEEAKSLTDGLSPSFTKGAAIFYLMRNPKILNFIESLVGPEILCHPTHVVRPRMRDDTHMYGYRYSGRRIPWHQDAGVLRPEGDNTLLVTAWIPFTEATMKNSCLAVIPGSHKHGLCYHETVNKPPIVSAYTIPEEKLPLGKPKPLPIKPGGFLLFNNFICHSSMPNASDSIRWSVDLRYQDLSKPTGHPYFEGFIVRSRKAPEGEFTYPEWVSMWEKQLVHSEPWPPIARWPNPI